MRRDICGSLSSWAACLVAVSACAGSATTAYPKPLDELRATLETSLVVELAESAEVPYEDGVERFLKQKGLLPWNLLENTFGPLSLRRVFTVLEPVEIQDLILEAKRRDPDYEDGRLLSLFYLDLPPEVLPQDVAKEMRQFDVVKNVYLDLPGDEPTTVQPEDDSGFVHQGYLQPAPSGIDAVFAWGIPGGTGKGQALVDVESGWSLDHEDLPKNIGLIYGDIRDWSRGHGTQVLGVICAVDNDKGCVGITPRLRAVDVASYYKGERPDAIVAALDRLQPGDVLLIEGQIVGKKLPIEVLDAEFEAIRLATALGYVVVEAAGNGSENLDAIPVLDPASPEYRDSKAILVGAASSDEAHFRLSTSNFGKRLDCFAWGENVSTTSSDSSGTTNLYTRFFGGTSSAAAIVAGAALVVQGMAESHLGKRFTPEELRQILGDRDIGTPSHDSQRDRIGVMPDLRRIFEKYIASGAGGGTE